MFGLFLFGKPRGKKSFMSTSKMLIIPVGQITCEWFYYPSQYWYLGKKADRKIFIPGHLLTAAANNHCSAANTSCFDHFLTLVSFMPFPDRVNHYFIFNIMKKETPQQHQRRHQPTIPTECLGLQWERERAPPCGEATAIHPSEGRRDTSIATVWHSNSLFEWS